MSFDPNRAWLKGPDFFTRFKPVEAEPLASAGLRDDDELLVVQRNGERVAYIMQQMAYHHCAQGELGGEQYVVSF